MRETVWSIKMVIRLLLGTVVISVLLTRAFSNSETRFSNGAYFTGIDKVLVSCPSATVLVENSINCAHECLKFPKCFSLNYETSAKYFGSCELFDRILSFEDTRNLQEKQGFTFMQMVPLFSKPKSCLEYLRAGVRTSGIYHIYDSKGIPYKSICDFDSEPNSAWTLIMSFPRSLLSMFKSSAMFKNQPLNEDNPDYRGYRLAFERMKALRDASTHWRITCSFPEYGVDYRDYVRAKFSDFDMLTFVGSGTCFKAEYIDVRGHNCTGCTSAWWQVDGSYAVHHDSSSTACEFGSTSGALASEDDFGYYAIYNTAFRCVSESSSTTNHWIGGYI